MYYRGALREGLEREREREREEIGRTYKEKKGVSEEHSFVITHS